ncbi:MAG: F0F1 ATP synthase subunit delta [Salinibacterium sp.]|nr:F0F1 ATP synthase subunit delta [Salinibacterium sp.]
MGSATRESLIAATATLSGRGSVDFATGEQLLEAALVVDGSPALRSALADDSAPAAGRASIVNAVFGGYTADAKAVLESLASGRWSSEDDFVAAIERLGIRAVASSAASSVSINDELFAFATAVSSDPGLELALGSRLGLVDNKIALVHRLMAKASKQTVAILTALISQPRGRRITELVRYAATIVAEESGQTIASITVAAPLTAAQRERLARALAAQHGSAIRINELVDPTVLGGMRVQIGDEVIDGSVANRIADLRLRLAS